MLTRLSADIFIHENQEHMRTTIISIIFEVIFIISKHSPNEAVRLQDQGTDKKGLGSKTQPDSLCSFHGKHYDYTQKIKHRIAI